jgi:hypothetical protein
VSARSARGVAITGLVLAALLGTATPVRAFDWSRVQGHTSFGYGRLTVAHAPGGSVGITVGFDYPIRPGLDAGIDLGLSLYGNRIVSRGSLDATIDYGSQEVLFLTHWQVKLGPLTRVSIGPGLTHARAELSVSAGGAEFLDLAVDDVAPTAAVDLAMIRRRPAPVRVALITGWRGAFLEGEDWHQFSLRFGIHY